MSNVQSKTFNTRWLSKDRSRNESAARFDRVVTMFVRDDGAVTEEGYDSPGWAVSGKTKGELVNYANLEEGEGLLSDDSRMTSVVRIRYRPGLSAVEAAVVDGRAYDVLNWNEDLNNPRRRYAWLHLADAPQLKSALDDAV